MMIRFSLNRLVLAGVLGMLSLTACGDLLDVELPGNIQADELNDPAAVDVMVDGAVADFECAFSAYVLKTGLWTNELINSSGLRITNLRELRFRPAEDRGTDQCATGTGTGNPDFYLPLQIARFQAEDVAGRLETFAAQGAEIQGLDATLGELAAYAGYSYQLLGEAMCEVAFDEGPIVSPAATFSIAEARFTEALSLARAVGDEQTESWALVGRARARVNLGDMSGAAADAGEVPEGFVKYVTHSNVTPRRMNRVYLGNHANRTETIPSAVPSQIYDYRNLTVEGVPDPRVPVMDMGRTGQDGQSDLWLQLLYTDGSDPMPLASWEEAQLLLAEAEGGQVAVQAINRLRDHHGLPQFESTDPVEIQNQIIEERRRQLWLRGTRMGDMIRFDETWVSGNNHKDQPYGTMTCFTLPQVEVDNNPSIGG